MPPQKPVVLTADDASHKLECTAAEDSKTRCINGGKCYAIMASAKHRSAGCMCADSYTGDRCEFRRVDPDLWMSKETEVARTASLAGGLTLSFIILTAVIVAVIIYFKCKPKVELRRQQRSSKMRERSSARIHSKETNCSTAGEEQECRLSIPEAAEVCYKSTGVCCEPERQRPVSRRLQPLLPPLNLTATTPTTEQQSDEEEQLLSPRQRFFIELYTESGLVTPQSVRREYDTPQSVRRADDTPQSVSRADGNPHFVRTADDTSQFVRSADVGDEKFTNRKPLTHSRNSCTNHRPTNINS